VSEAIHDHLIVPGAGKTKACRRTNGLAVGCSIVRQAEVRSATFVEGGRMFVNEGDAWTSRQREGFEGHHICFPFGRRLFFDAIFFGRIRPSGITYRCRPRGEGRHMTLNRRLSAGKNRLLEGRAGPRGDLTFSLCAAGKTRAHAGGRVVASARLGCPRAVGVRAIACCATGGGIAVKAKNTRPASPACRVVVAMDIERRPYCAPTRAARGLCNRGPATRAIRASRFFAQPTRRSLIPGAELQLPKILFGGAVCN